MSSANSEANSSYSSQSSASSSTTCSSETSDSTFTSSSTTCSFLDRLRAPKLSVLSRKRKIHSNPPPPVGKKRSIHNTHKSDPKTVRPSQRVKDFPGEEFVESAGKLFCRACREVLAVKRSVVQNHVRSKKHRDSKDKMKLKVTRERDIVEALHEHDASTHRKGETLPDEQSVHRVRIVTTFMKCGIPITKCQQSDLRCLLEDGGYRLTDPRHLLDLVPFVLQQERTKIRSEINGKHLSVTFDGTTRMGEVLAIIVRFINDWYVEQRLVRLEFIQKSVTEEELARELISNLSVLLGIESNNWIAMMHDQASVNGAAIRIVRVVYPVMVDIGCVSHTLDLVGDKFKAPTLDLFFTQWISLFSHSPKAKAYWKEQTGLSMPSYSATRWWSRWEIYSLVLRQFGDVEVFLKSHDDIGQSTRTRLLDVMSQPQTKAVLQLELAAVVDVGSYFVKATYNLEGDGILVVKCYEEILKIRNAIHTKHYPNLKAVARAMSPSDTTAQQKLIDYGLSCVQSGLTYFNEKFGQDSSHPIAVFRIARLFNPIAAVEIQPAAADIDEFSVFPFLSPQNIEQLKAELPAHLARASAISSSNPESCNYLNWWKTNGPELPQWSQAAQDVFLIQPSSASAERVFSMLNKFSDNQTNALEDYVESSVMLQYNYTKNNA